MLQILSRSPPHDETIERPVRAEAFLTAAPRTRYYGWSIVAVCILCSALSSPGQSFVLSLYVDPLIDASGVSRVALASLYGAATLAAALCLPFVGQVADRVPGRWFLGVVIALLGTAVALLALARGPVLLAIAFFALRLLGQGAIGLGTLTTTVRWFSRYRARALSFVGLGYALGEMVFPALILGIMSVAGWQASLLVLAAAYVVVFAPAVFGSIRERDARREPLDGIAPMVRTAADPRTVLDSADSFTAGQAVRTSAFWLALTAAALMPMIMTGLIFHQVALFASFGWPAVLVASSFLAYAVAGSIAAVLTGFALERVQPRWGFIASGATGIMALAATSLPLAAPAAAVLYGALLGVAGGMSNSTNAVVWPAYFGVASVGSIKGIVNGVRNGGTALGAPLVAMLLLPGAPVSPVVTLAGLLVLMAGVACAMRPPRRLELAPAAPDPELSAQRAA